MFCNMVYLGCFPLKNKSDSIKQREVLHTSLVVFKDVYVLLSLFSWSFSYLHFNENHGGYFNLVMRPEKT